jgi:hypothetical protein
MPVAVLKLADFPDNWRGLADEAARPRPAMKAKALNCFGFPILARLVLRDLHLRPRSL